MCPSLYYLTLTQEMNAEAQGRAFELAVGAVLARLPGYLYYWREGHFEVDYVYQENKIRIAIEVKSSRVRHAKGLEKFAMQFPDSKCVILTPDQFHQFSAQPQAYLKNVATRL